MQKIRQIFKTVFEKIRSFIECLKKSIGYRIAEFAVVDAELKFRGDMNFMKNGRV